MTLTDTFKCFLLFSLLVGSNADEITPTKITFVALDDNQPTKGSVKLAPPATIETQPKVVQLIEGILYPTENGFFMTGSVTFIADQGYFMVVDTPSATDQVAKDQLFKGLNALGIVPGQIQIAITTHGHPDHFGQGNFFSNAKHFFGPYAYNGGTFTRTELFNKNEIQLTKNVELWNTPGHTNQDVSVIVRNVPNYGTVAVVGDLFYSEIDALSDSQDWQRDALDGKLGVENRRRVLCASDFVVPGHAKMFRVTNEMRSRNNCPLTLSIAGSANDLGTFRSDPPIRQRETPTLETILQPTVITLPPALQPNISTMHQPRIYAAETLTNPTVPLPTESQQANAMNPVPISFSIQQQSVPYAGQQQQISAASHQPLLNAETIQNLQQSILLPLLESTAANLANYLTAAQSNSVPVPQIAASQVRTTYPTLYPTQLQMLPQKRTKRR